MKLKHWRKQQDLTLAQVADLAGVSASTMSRYETCKRRPEWPILQRLVTLTGGAVQPNDFFTDEASV